MTPRQTSMEGLYDFVFICLYTIEKTGANVYKPFGEKNVAV